MENRFGCGNFFSFPNPEPITILMKEV